MQLFYETSIYLKPKSDKACTKKQSKQKRPSNYRTCIKIVPSSSICNSQEPETVNITHNEWMIKQTVLHQYNGILHSNPKKLAFDKQQL